MPFHWFRIDDVLPLAEHALACERHTITRAEVLAGANTGPALIFSSTPTGAGLRSNGSPFWCDANGGQHAARARTWRHTPTAATGHVHPAGRQDAFLPLTSPVAYLLRTARQTGESWLTIDIDPRDQHLIAPYALRTTEYHDNPVPAGAQWKKATVSCADVADIGYPALIPVDYTSAEGDALPRFDLNTIVRIVNDLDHLRTSPAVDTMPGEYPILRLHGNELIVLEELPARGNWTYRQVERLQPDRDGTFALGAYQWAWRTVTEPSAPSLVRRWLTAASNRRHPSGPDRPLQP